ncbi:MAG: hypothetical protein P0S94_04145 [Simkaniaceae bacterium]|nr:hypothetical protein [Simkaniaceae bacterium]
MSVSPSYEDGFHLDRPVVVSNQNFNCQEPEKLVKDIGKVFEEHLEGLRSMHESLQSIQSQVDESNALSIAMAFNELSIEFSKSHQVYRLDASLTRIQTRLIAHREIFTFRHDIVAMAALLRGGSLYVIENAIHFVTPEPLSASSPFK